MKKRLLSLCLTAALCLSLLPTAALADETGETADTQSRVTYYDGKTGETESTVYYTALDTALTVWDQDWYYAGSSLAFTGGVTVEGTVNLILADGANLVIEDGLTLADGAALTIYAAGADLSDSLGKLSVKNEDGYAVSGSGTADLRSGRLDVYSGSGRALEPSVKLTSGGGSREHLLTRLLDCTPSSPTIKLAEWWGKDIALSWFQLEPCGHSDYEAVKVDASRHKYVCPDCGDTKTKGGEIVVDVCTFETNDSDYVDRTKPLTGEGHFLLCDELCGNVSPTPTAHEATTAIPTDDGKGHTQRCWVCFYTPTENNPVEQHHYDKEGICENCGFQPVARDAAGDLYESVNDALRAAADGGTVTLEAHTDSKELCEGVVFDCADKSVTLEMNGYTLTTSGNPTLTVENGTLKITGDATINQTGTSHDLAAPAVKVTGGRVIFESNLTATGASGKPAVEVTNGTLRLKAGDVLNGGVSVASGTVVDLLGENLAFAKKDDTSTIVKGDVKSISENVTVVAHTHDFKLNSDGNYVCACGYVCPHNEFENGVCKICGNGCAHTSVDENGVCRNCKTQMAAKIEVGGTTTYTTDLGTTLYKAADGTKITLLANAAVGTVILKDKTVTLDLNGKTVKNSGRGSAPIQIVSSNSPAKLIITGSGSFISSNQPFVVANGTLDLSGWTGDNSFIYWVTISGASSRFISPTGAGKIDRLAFINSDTEQAADTASLNGGRYDEIAYKREKMIKLGDLLAEGYAFRQNGTFLEYAKELKNKDTVKKVEVVKCPHPDAKDGKCLYCGQTGILARVGDTTYDDVGKAVKDWLANGGTLTLYDNAPTYSNGNDVDFSSGSNNPFIIDLNGFRFNYAGAAITLNGGKSLTIKDSREKESSNGAFGPLVADNGTLTLESGYLQKLTVPSDSLATILLKGGKVSALACPVPVFNLLGNGYCLMSGNITVDPTTILNSGTGTYTIKNPQPLITADKKNGSSSKGERKIPFTLSLKANDSEVGRMQFKWYFIKEDGTTALLAESGDVTATTNDVFTYDATTQSKVAAGWDDTDLKVRDKPYDVICVVTGKDSNGAYLWQTPLRGYKLTIEQTDLKDLKLEFTQVEDTSGFAGPFKGNIKDGKGTFVFEPYGGDVGDASTLTYCFEVYLDGQELEKGKDYIIVDKSNEAKYAGAHTLTIQGMGDYKGTATHTWRIEPYKLTRENYNPPNITKVYDGTTGFDFSKDGNWGSFKENVANRPNDAGTGKNPALGADGNAISIYLKPEDLKASAVTLDSPDVGDRTASYTITLKAREGQSEPNFAFEDGEPPTIQVTAPAYITKASLSPLPEAGKLNVANNHAGVYTLDLAALLPTLDSPKEYGKVTYELDATMLASGYYAVGTATIENGKLILPIKAVETKKQAALVLSRSRSLQPTTMTSP